ncbi:MAG: ABC transporter ATP-binding protein [Acidobacteriota bacterium]|jgi:lipoprotein-releasing system ATP-binding protein|nr:ABC transporter ATP-binding protein [Acidobacteriota bacterium]
MTERILEARQVEKRFRLPDRSELMVLSGLDLVVERGTMVAVTGASGSGKSTLMHLLGGLDHPDKGRVSFQDRDLGSLSSADLAEFRNRHLGFVFQFHYLMPELTVIENVAFPRLVKRFQRREALAQARLRLEEVGLQDKAGVMPHQLSGGERQRAAIARCLVNDPHLILADEPTGNLDWNTGDKVFALFRDLVTRSGRTAVVVTHNEAQARLADAVYHLEHGRLIATRPGNA